MEGSTSLNSLHRGVVSLLTMKYRCSCIAAHDTSAAEYSCAGPSCANAFVSVGLILTIL